MKAIKLLFTFIFIFGLSMSVQSQDVHYPDWDMNGSDMAQFVGDKIAEQLSSVFLEKIVDEDGVYFMYKTYYDTDYTMMSTFRRVVNEYNDVQQLKGWSNEGGIICTAFRIVDFDKSIYGICFSEDAEVYNVSHMVIETDNKRRI